MDVTWRSVALALAFLIGLPAPALRAEVLSITNPTIRSFLCVGPGCLDIESPGGDELRLKGNNVLLHFQDNSTGADRATRDWRIEINEPSANGRDAFAIRDVQTGHKVLTLLGDAPADALFVDGAGRLGLGTGLPTANLHIEDSSAATLRLHRNTAGGGAVSDWLIAATDGGLALSEQGSATPLRIAPGAPEAALVLGSAGALGLGTATPAAPLHMRRNSTDSPGITPVGILVEDIGTNTPRGLLALRNNGNVFFALENTAIAAGDNTGRQWNFQNNGGEFRVTTAPGGTGEIEMQLTTAGEMYVKGGYFVGNIGGGTTELNVPDYVFADDYDLRPLSEVQAFIDTHSHLPDVPSAAEINAQGLNMTDMQMRLLKKVEELTLYTLEQEAQLAEVPALRAELTRMDALEAENAALAVRLARLEALIPD